MSQYLLSVHDVKDGPQPSDEELPKIYAAVDAFNQEVRDAGAWVFAGGLETDHECHARRRDRDPSRW